MSSTHRGPFPSCQCRSGSLDLPLFLFATWTTELVVSAEQQNYSLTVESAVHPNQHTLLSPPFRNFVAGTSWAIFSQDGLNVPSDPEFIKALSQILAPFICADVDTQRRKNILDSSIRDSPFRFIQLLVEACKIAIVKNFNSPGLRYQSDPLDPHGNHNSAYPNRGKVPLLPLSRVVAAQEFLAVILEVAAVDGVTDVGHQPHHEL